MVCRETGEPLALKESFPANNCLLTNTALVGYMGYREIVTIGILEKRKDQIKISTETDDGVGISLEFPIYHQQNIENYNSKYQIQIKIHECHTER